MIIILAILLILILNYFNIRICFIYNLFRIPCPGCGCTRATLAFLNGNIVESIRYNPLPIIIFIVLSIVYLWKLIDFIKNTKTFNFFIEKYKTIVIILTIALTIIIWIINVNNSLLY